VLSINHALQSKLSFPYFYGLNISAFMKLLTTITLLLFSCSLYAQIYGTTDEGLRVQLNENGTWKYLERDTNAVIVTINPQPFLKPGNAIALKKSTQNPMGIYYNPVKWKVAKEKNNEDAEFEFNLVKGDGYAMMLNEKIEIPLDNLKKIAFETLSENAPDAKIDKAEYRTVNALKVLHLEMSGTMQGIKFVFLGYYFSNERGTTQLVCFTAKSLIKEYKADFDDFLNGLIEEVK
jgi:hypothetical protein